MHIAMIIDQDRLAAEHAMLNRLAISLIAEGARVTRIIPDGVLENEVLQASEASVALVPRVTMPMDRLPWIRKRRREIAEELLGRPRPEALLAFGDRAWGVAADLSAALEAPVAIEVWRIDQLRAARRALARHHAAAAIAGSYALGQQLASATSPDLVSVAPIGASASLRHAPPTQGALTTVAVIGAGRDATMYMACLGALASAARDQPDLRVILELRGPHQHEIWREAARLDLLPRTSTLSNASPYRGLIAECDVILAPERLGEVRTMVLDGMAAGCPTISGRNAAMDVLQDGETAIVIEEPAVEAWTTALRRLLGDPTSARALGRAGQAAAAERHGSAEQGRRIVETAATMVSGGAYAFTEST